MNQRLPFLLWAILLTMWLLLNGTLAIGHFVLGALLALGVVLAVSRMRPLQPRIRRPLAAAKLGFTVLVDVIRSNIAVARLILGFTGGRTITSGFLTIPLELRDPHGLAALAMILTATPGTVWTQFLEEQGTLTLHVLDLEDENHWRRLIKERYERPLMEIFE